LSGVARLGDPRQECPRIAFVTIGHRGFHPSLHNSTEAHSRPSRQAVCDTGNLRVIERPDVSWEGSHRPLRPCITYRPRGAGTNGRGDHHSSATTASLPALSSFASHPRVHPGRTEHLADGIVITPSHTSSRERCLQLQQTLTNGGPDDTDPPPPLRVGSKNVPTSCFGVNAGAKRVPVAERFHQGCDHGMRKTCPPYVKTPTSSPWMPFGRRPKLGVDPLGGAAVLTLLGTYHELKLSFEHQAVVTKSLTPILLS